MNKGKRKESFVFYKDWYKAVAKMDDATRLEVYDGIMRYAFDGEVGEISPMANVALNFVLPKMLRDIERYEAVVARNKENGKKGGRPKKTKNPKNPNGFEENPNNLDNDNDNDNDNDDDDDDDIFVSSSSSPPTIKEEIKEMLSDNSWLTDVGKLLCLDIPTLKASLSVFEMDCLCRGKENHKDIKDAKRHFVSWYQKRKEKEDGKSKYIGYDERRERERQARLRGYAERIARIRTGESED